MLCLRTSQLGVQQSTQLPPVYSRIMPTAVGVSKAIFFKEMRRKVKYRLQIAVVSFTGVQVRICALVDTERHSMTPFL